MSLVARAPGKLVLSGAYAVLEGAPAIVTAVDRYAVADASTSASFVTPEVEEALRLRGESFAPDFDASALRAGDRKLGLGSSAAILVASLAALELKTSPDLDDEQLAARLFRPALEAHRRAQGGGSGIDVVTSTLGGTQACVVVNGEPYATAVSLPLGLVIEVFSSPAEASTKEMLRSVEAFRKASPREHHALFEKLKEASRAAVRAKDARAFVEALRAQADLFQELGKRAGAPIVTDAMARLDALAREDEGVILPSGAGGGDVVLWVGVTQTSPAVLHAAALEGFEPLPLSLGARGVHAVAVAGRSS